MKFIRILSLILGLVFLGCVPQKMISPDPVVVKLKIEGVDSIKVEEFDKVARSMEIPYSLGEYSHNTFIVNNIAYMKIWGSLGASDASFLWNDLTLLKTNNIKHIELYINSGGGGAFDGMSVADQFENFIKGGGIVNAHASGLVASATVPIFAVCSKRSATEATIFMVHESSLFKYIANESKSDIESQKNLMDLLETTYLSRLVRHSKLTLEEWKEKEKEATWFCAKKALEWGLVDEIE